MFRGDPYILISSIYHQNDSKTLQAQNKGLSMSQHNKRTNTVDAGVVLAGAGSVPEDRLIDE